MPKQHREYVAWNGERFLNWAEKIGEYNKNVVQRFLSRNQVEQQGYKACMALLKLSDNHSALRLEQACKRALSFTERPSLIEPKVRSIQIILKSGQDNLPQVEPVPGQHETSSRTFARGKEYYRRKEEN